MANQLASDLCRVHARVAPDIGRFYGPVGDDMGLGTGVILRDCRLAFADPDEKRYRTGIGPALVLTHECDIDDANARHFNDLFLAFPIMRLEDFCLEYETDHGVNSWTSFLPQLAGDYVIRAMYLPPVPPAFRYPDLDEGGVIYLNQLSHSCVAWVEDFKAQAICTLSVFGLRHFDVKIANLWNREKADRLPFSP
jgi:hypothetical protein